MSKALRLETPHSISNSATQTRLVTFLQGATRELSASRGKTPGAFLCCWGRWQRSPLGYCPGQTLCNRGRWKHRPESTVAPWEGARRGQWSRSGRWFDQTQTPENIVGGWCVQRGCLLRITVGGTKANYRLQLEVPRQVMITVGGTEINYGLHLEVRRQIMDYRRRYETNYGLQLEVQRQIIGYSWRYGDKLWLRLEVWRQIMGYSWRNKDKLWLQLEVWRQIADYSWRYWDKLWLTVGGTETNSGNETDDCLECLCANESFCLMSTETRLFIRDGRLWAWMHGEIKASHDNYEKVGCMENPWKIIS